MGNRRGGDPLLWDSPRLGRGKDDVLPYADSLRASLQDWWGWFLREDRVGHFRQRHQGGQRSEGETCRGILGVLMRGPLSPEYMKWVDVQGVLSSP